MSEVEVVIPKVEMVEENKTQRCLVELLIHSKESDKDKLMNKVAKKLQEQMSKMKDGKYCRILYYCGSDDAEERKKWLIENSVCKYYVFPQKGEELHIKPDFFKNVITKIRKFEDSAKAMKEADIVYKPQK